MAESDGARLLEGLCGADANAVLSDVLPFSPDAGLRGDARAAARIRVFDLIREVQSTGQVEVEMVDQVVREGELQGWPDVVRLGMFLRVIFARYIEKCDTDDRVEALLEHAVADDDRVMTALALAVRARDERARGALLRHDPDRDLARATVLLEGVSGPCTEAVSAHVECALAYGDLDLWELKLAHYEAAEACIDPAERPEHRRAVLLYNRADIQVSWAAVLREVAGPDELRSRAALAKRALAEAAGGEMPEDWKAELRILEDLLDAIVSTPTRGQPEPAVVEGPYRGHVYFAHALREADPLIALRYCERALAHIDCYEASHVHLCAMGYAAELESAAAGRETAGQRWGRALAQRRWRQRLSNRASLESLISAQRLEQERSVLHHAAFIDELTGLANRRALSRWTQERLAGGGRDVAVIALDCDHFKSVNDTFGHAVGDQVLVRIAELMRAGIRDQDLAVRLGGDEFLVVLASDDRDSVQARGAALAASIAGVDWESIACGLSVTAAWGTAYGPLDGLEAVRDEADGALYRAKRSRGRHAESPGLAGPSIDP